MSERLRLTAGVRYTGKTGTDSATCIHAISMAQYSPRGCVAPWEHLCRHWVSSLMNLTVTGAKTAPPLVSLRWDVTDFSMLYASVSTGFQSRWL